MRIRFTPGLLTLALLGLPACSPDEPGEDQPSAAPQTEPGVEPAQVPPPPGADTLTQLNR